MPPLPASDLAFIKKCAQAMSPGYALKYTGWEAIAARPEQAGRARPTARGDDQGDRAGVRRIAG